MSDQSDALNKLVRERGIRIDNAPPMARCVDVHNDDMLPRIPLPRDGEQMISFAAKAGEIVGSNGLYRRESLPVTIDPETGSIEPMNPYRFQTYCEAHCTPIAWKGNSAQPQTMNVREAEACLRADVFIRPLRKLRRVNFVRLPVMRRDGRIELLPKGWDPESSIFTMPDCLDYDPAWDLERSKLFLGDILGEFPFVDERSRAAHILAMAAVFGADLLTVGTKPLNFCYRANASRAGKNLLVTTAIAGPHGTVRIQAIPEDGAEFRKVLDSEALNGASYIVLDEASGKVANSQLNAFLTANRWTGRILGSQKHFCVDQSAIVFLIGNAIELSADLAGRCVLVDLYVSEANPQERQIRRVMNESYLTRSNVRADILSALFALVRHWDRSLRPSSSLLFRGFEDWCRVFGGIVEAAGYPSPFRSIIEEVDFDFADMRALVAKLSEGIETCAEYDFLEVVDVARSIGAFEWRLGAVAGDALKPRDKSWFGKLLSLRYGGCTFRLKDGRRAQWGRRGRNRQRRYTLRIL